MRLYNKLKEEQSHQDKQPQLLKAYAEMKDTGNTEVLINELQKAADLVLKNIAQKNDYDIISTLVPAKCIECIRNIKREEEIDYDFFEYIESEAKDILDKKSIATEDNEHQNVDVDYEKFFKSTNRSFGRIAEVCQDEISTAIEYGIIHFDPIYKSCEEYAHYAIYNVKKAPKEEDLVFRDGNVGFECVAFKNHGAVIAKNGDRNNIQDYAAQLAYEHVIGRHPIDMEMLVMMNQIAKEHDPHLEEAYEKVKHGGNEKEFVAALQKTVDLCLRGHYFGKTEDNIQVIASCTDLIQKIKNKEIPYPYTHDTCNQIEKLTKNSKQRSAKYLIISGTPIDREVLSYNQYKRFVDDITGGYCPGFTELEENVKRAKTAIEDGLRAHNIKFTTSEDVVRLKSDAFENGTIDIQLDSKNDNHIDYFLSDVLTVNSLTDKCHIDIEKLEEMNKKHSINRQIEPEIEQ